MVPPDTRVTLVCGLAAPDTSRPQARGPFATTIPARTCFSWRGGAPQGHDHWSENNRPGLRGSGFDGDLVAEALEAMDEATLFRVTVALFEVHIAPGIGIVRAGEQLGIEYVPTPVKAAGIVDVVDVQLNTAEPVARQVPPIAAHFAVTDPAAFTSR